MALDHSLPHSPFTIYHSPLEKPVLLITEDNADVLQLMVQASF